MPWRRTFSIGLTKKSKKLLTSFATENSEITEKDRTFFHFFKKAFLGVLGELGGFENFKEEELRKKDLIDPGKSRRYYYNYKRQVLCEYNGSDEFQQWYAYGNYIDEVLVMKAGANDYYYVHDHLYSPVALANSGGTILERYEYDAYRNPTIWNADFTAERDNSNYGNP